jgi:SAM-dependent methyltransferase
MSRPSDAAAWDERYGTAEFVWSTEPNRFLPPAVADLTPGRALDLACGEGRNAVWLATRGWRVTGVDFSAVGLEKAARLATASGVRAEWIRADVTAWASPPSFDLVIVLYLHLLPAGRGAALGTAARALAPGGTLVVVGHDLANLADGIGGPQDPEVLATAEDIRCDLERAGVDDLVVDRAERIERPVETDAGPVMALDCLVRAHRPASYGSPPDARSSA